MKHFRQTLHQEQLLFATLMLTDILSLGAGVTKARAITANSPGNPLMAENKQKEAAVVWVYPPRSGEACTADLGPLW